MPKYQRKPSGLPEDIANLVEVYNPTDISDILPTATQAKPPMPPLPGMVPEAEAALLGRASRQAIMSRMGSGMAPNPWMFLDLLRPTELGKEVPPNEWVGPAYPMGFIEGPSRKQKMQKSIEDIELRDIAETQRKKEFKPKTGVIPQETSPSTRQEKEVERRVWMRKKIKEGSY